MKSFNFYLNEKHKNGTKLYKKNSQGAYTADDSENHDCEEEHPGISHKKWAVSKETDENWALAPKGKGRKAAKALYRKEENEIQISAIDIKEDAW